MIDFVDTSLFVRITFWIAIEKTCTMYFYINQTGLFCRTCRFCIRESLIFKLEMCIHLFINKIVRQYLGLIFYHFRLFIRTSICNMIKAQSSLP